MPSSANNGEWSKLVPFRVWVLQEAAGAGTFDTDQDKATTPTLNFDNLIPDNLKSGFINRIHYRLNFANAVTYTLRIWQAAIANDYESNLNMLYESATLRADDADYDITEKYIPFILVNVGYMYYSIDWSAACGNIQGFIEVSGETYE